MKEWVDPAPMESMERSQQNAASGIAFYGQRLPNAVSIPVPVIPKSAVPYFSVQLATIVRQ
jgi:phage tail protein X